MPEAKGIEALTGWLTYELQPTDYLKDPKVSFRLRYLDPIEVTDAVRQGGVNYLSAVRELALSAVAEWDLTAGGKPIPVNDATKMAYLRHLLAEPLVVSDDDKKRAEEASKATGEEVKPTGSLLAIAITRDAQKRSLFLKN